jgi:hypothetical protein
MVCKYMVSDESHESLRVLLRLNSTNPSAALAQQPYFDEMLGLLVHVPKLQIVDDAHMVNVATVFTQKLMATKHVSLWIPLVILIEIFGAFDPLFFRSTI